MKPNSMERMGAGSAASAVADGAATGSERAPLLRAGGYPAWKPAMDVYLQRHGAAGVHKEPLTEAEWLLDCKAVATWGQQSLAAARALARGGLAVNKDEAKQQQDDSPGVEEKAARLLVAANVERSHKAFGSIFAAIPEDLRLQVAHLAQGWAYGLWMWLERKFQSTEPDSVAVLLLRWMQLQQDKGESFDAYRARVNELAALLKHAKEPQSHTMYCVQLLDRLQPQYTSVVLALKNGTLLKDVSQVDWETVTAMINAHERNDRQFAEAAANEAIAMAARTAPDSYRSAAARGQSPVRSQSPVTEQRRDRGSGNTHGGDRDRGSGSRSRSLQEVQCFNCGKYGHVQRNCQKARTAGNNGSAGSSGTFRRDENASSVVKKTGAETAFAVKNMRVRGQVTTTDKHGWTRIEKKSGAWRKMESKEAPLRGSNPAVGSGEWRQGGTPVSSAIPVRGDQRADGAPISSRPRAALKMGIVSGERSSSAGASTSAALAAKSAAASPASSDSQSRVKVIPKSCLKVPGIASQKAAGSERHVYWNMRIQPKHTAAAIGKGTTGLAKGIADAAEKAMSVQQPREFGIDSMASIHITGNKALFTRGLRSCKPFTVVMADMGEQRISQVGSVELHIDVAPGRTVSYLIDDVHFHPKFAGSNLLSLDGLTANGWKFSSEKAETFLVTPRDGLKVFLNKDNRVSILRCSVSKPSVASQSGTQRVYSLGKTQWDNAEDLVLLHSRLGHMGFDRMVNIIKSQHTEGIGRLNMSEAVLKEARGRVLECKACKQGKGTRTAFGHRGLDKGSAPGEALHMDTYYMKYDRADGTPSVEYGLTLSCPHTTARWSTRVSSKDQMAQRVIGVIRQIQTQMGCTVKRLYTDGGSEFVNQTIKTFCSQQGIELHYPPANTPQLNSVAERQVRACKDAGRTLLMHAGLPARFGPRAIEHSTFVWNRTNVAPATGRTPFEVLLKKKPTIQHIGVFGCDAYYHVARSRRGTFDAKMLPGIYLGHSYERGCPIVYDLNSGQEVFTRDVEFLDRRFTHAAALVAGGEQLQAALSAARPQPRKGNGGRGASGSNSDVYDVERILAKRTALDGTTEYHVKWTNFDESEATWEPAENVEAGASEVIHDFEEEQRELEDRSVVDSEEREGLASAAGPPAVAPGVAAAAEESEQSGSAPPAADSAAAAAPAPVVPAADVAVASAPAPRRRSPRDHASSASMNAGQQHVQMAMSVISSSLPGGDVRLNDADTQLVCAVASGLAQLETKTPNTFREAMNSDDAPHWLVATDKEVAGCEQMGVWELVPRSSVPKWHTIIGCKWVFKIKTDSSGAVDVYKARITPKGFLQKFGTNFFETFAATGKYKSLRLGLSITAACGHNLEQMDVPQAFLNADVDEEVYMELPEGYRKGREHLVCLLKKALYGLKQAPRNWYLLISKFVQEELTYKATVSDPCLFFKRSRSGRLMLLFLFVDDFQTSYHPEDRAEWDELKRKLVERFKTKDLGASTWILGMRISRDLKARTITLDQELYLSKALERHGMDQCKPVSTPGVPGGSNAAAHSDESDGAASSATVDRQLYMEMVGTVMYPAISCRPDIAHAAQKLAQAMQNPTQEDMLAAKRVFRYLAGTKDIGLIFGSRSDKVLDTRGRNHFRLDVCAFADADWANDKADRKSITGWVAKVNGDPISWASKKQRTVAQSTCEAELYAEAAAIQEVLWLRGLLHELGLHVQTGSLVYGDNQSTLAISKNGIKGERTKHVDVKYHFITETIESGKVQLKWIPTQEQQADIFTKALTAPVFEHLRKLLMTR